MGKKSKIFYYTLLIVNIACFLLELLPPPIGDVAYFRYSFPVSLILIGILLIIRAINLKIDSSLFFGIIFMLIGVFNVVSYVFGVMKIDVNILWPYYLFAISIASLITALYFKDKLQIKLFVLFLGFGAITALFVYKIITILWVFITLMIVWFVAYFVFNIIMAKRRK